MPSTISIKDDMQQLFLHRQIICDIVKASPFFGSDYTDKYFWNKQDHPYKNLCNCLLWCESWLDKIKVSNDLLKRFPKTNSAEKLIVNEEIKNKIQVMFVLANYILEKILNNKVDISDFGVLTQYNLEEKLFTEITPNLDFLRPKLKAMHSVLKEMRPILEKNKIIMQDLKDCFVDAHLSMKQLEVNLYKLVAKYGIDELNKYAKSAWYLYDTFNIKEILELSFLCLSNYSGSYNDIVFQDIYFNNGFRVEEVLFIPSKYTFPRCADVLIFNNAAFYININTCEVDTFNLLNYTSENRLNITKQYLDNLSEKELKIKGLELPLNRLIRIMCFEFITLNHKYSELMKKLNKLLQQNLSIWSMDSVETIIDMYNELYWGTRHEETGILHYGLNAMDPHYHPKSFISSTWRYVTRGTTNADELIKQIELSIIDKWQIEHYKIIYLLDELASILKNNYMKIEEAQLITNMLKDYIINKNLYSIYKIVLFFKSNIPFKEINEINNKNLHGQLHEIAEIAIRSLDYNNFNLIDITLTRNNK